VSRRPNRPRGPGPRGLSIVELMIGIAIGMFILAGATLVLTTQLGDNRRLLLEAQMQQDMRAAADMIARDIRRAGYWAHAYCLVWPAEDIASLPAECKDAAGAQLANPYVAMTPQAAPAGTPSVVYDRSTDEEGVVFGTDDNGVDTTPNRPRERVGFQLNAGTGAIDYMVGEDNWQALTDKDVMRVTRFDLTLNQRDAPVPCGADAACPVLGPGGCRLVQTYRDLAITIVAQARHDATVQRAMRDVVRLRNSVPRCI
jgi:type IV pilus assembly protein PilW